MSRVGVSCMVLTLGMCLGCGGGSKGQDASARDGSDAVSNDVASVDHGMPDGAKEGQREGAPADLAKDADEVLPGDAHVDTGTEVSSLHGCKPQAPSPECGGMGWTCTQLHVCCHGFGSDCIIEKWVPPDSGIVVSHTPCSSDEMCAANEYCQANTQCCPVGYTCDPADASVSQ